MRCTKTNNVCTANARIIAAWLCRIDARKKFVLLGGVKHDEQPITRRSAPWRLDRAADTSAATRTHLLHCHLLLHCHFLHFHCHFHHRHAQRPTRHADRSAAARPSCAAPAPRRRPRQRRPARWLTTIQKEQRRTRRTGRHFDHLRLRRHCCYHHDDACASQAGE